MIRKGQRAKVSHCKNATYSRPVSADVKSPQKGKISNGMATARQVLPAAMVTANLHKNKQQGVIEQAVVSDLKTKKVAQGKTITCAEVKLQVQERNLANVTKDITLDNLFQ